MSHTKVDDFFKMAQRNCLKCNNPVDETDIKEDNIEFWICPKCKKKNYKYSTKSWLGTGRFEGEHVIKKDIRKETRDLRGHKSIIQKEKDGWTHEVIDDQGKVIHKKHKKIQELEILKLCFLKVSSILHQNIQLIN